MAEMNVAELAEVLCAKLPAGDQLRLRFLAAKNTAEICKDIDGGNFEALVMGLFVVKNIMTSANKVAERLKNAR